MKWTKIEPGGSMPPSGLAVIMACYNREGQPRRLRAMYAAPITLEHYPDFDGDNNAVWDEVSDQYYIAAGWYEANEYDEIEWRVDGDVTHWMPLPDWPAMYNSIKPVR